MKLLPKEFRHAFEFRHSSWSFESVKSLMLPSTIPATVVLQDWKDWPMYTQPAGDFVYIRFHGKDKLYTSGYSKGVLDTWAKKMQEWKKAGLDIYAYFNNDALGYAVKNALRLKELTRSEYTNASE